MVRSQLRSQPSQARAQGFIMISCISHAFGANVMHVDYNVNQCEGKQLGCGM
jgi:hypothetical protein